MCFCVGGCCRGETLLLLLLLLWWCIPLFVSFLARSFVSAAINSSGFLLSGRVLIQGQGVTEYGVTDREGAQGGPGGGSGLVGGWGERRGRESGASVARLEKTTW
jgi:hypothetical protein